MRASSVAAVVERDAPALSVDARLQRAQALVVVGERWPFDGAPHTGFHIGAGTADPPVPDIRIVRR